VTDIVTDGASVTIDFDSRTGLHKIEIDTSAHADYAVGSDYMVMVNGITVDAGTLNSAIACFSIENRFNAAVTDGATLAAGAITDASLAGNMEIVFETDFGTNYNTTTNAWETNLTDTIGTLGNADFAAGALTSTEITSAAGITLANGAITDASLAGNMEIVFETDFGTNYNTTRNAWATNVQDSVGTGNLTADVIAISGDTTAADNLELQYDATGIVGDNFPATQAQLGAFTVGSGGIATTANSDTTVTTGTETLTYTATAALDLSYHEVAASGTIDMYYEFDVGSDGIPISVDWTGYVNTNNDNVEVSFLNWPSTYEQVGTIAGSVANTVQSEQFLATTAHVGTGANVGKVRLKLSSDGGDVATNLATDRVICTYTQAVTGIANGSTVTLAAATTNTNLVGNNWTLALGGQNISGSYIKGATVTGVSSGTSEVTFEDCDFGAGTYPPGHYHNCGFGVSDGLFTAASTGQYVFHNCFSVVAGAGSPDFTFAGIGAAVGINNRGWTGGSAYTLDTNCTLSHEVLAGGGTTITPADAAVEVRGRCRTLTLALADTDIGNSIQAVVDVGALVITSAGSSDSATINLYGHAGTVADASNGTTNNYLSGFVQTDAILTDTAVIGAAGAGLTDLGGMSTGMKAEVNVEAKDVLFTDTDAEPAQGLPAATTTLADKIGFLYKAWRNKSTQTATTYSLYNDDTSTVDHKATVSDDATTATKGEVATGP